MNPRVVDYKNAFTFQKPEHCTGMAKLKGKVQLRAAFIQNECKSNVAQEMSFANGFSNSSGELGQSQINKKQESKHSMQFNNYN